MKIVSLLPSATEIICRLGLVDSLVGVSHECDYPLQVRDLPVLTSSRIPHDSASTEIDTLVKQQLQNQEALYTLDIALLQALQPDLIVTQSLCNVCAVSVDQVEKALCDMKDDTILVNMEPFSFHDVLETIIEVGSKVGIIEQAKCVVTELQQRVEQVIKNSQGKLNNKLRVVFLEWLDPPFGTGHWTSELIEWAGAIDCLGNKHQTARYIDWDALREADPDVLYIACCGLQTERALHDMDAIRSKPGWDELQCVRKGRVYLSDGNAYFSRPGPRLVDSLEILAHALYPDIHSLSEELPPALVVA